MNACGELDDGTVCGAVALSRIGGNAWRDFFNSEGLLLGCVMEAGE